MAKIRPIDMLLINDLFEMGSGYVLDFNDRTFSHFFVSELDVDIDDPVYATNGTSKAKRLRAFLMAVDAPLAARTLNALWEYREAVRQRSGRVDKILNAEEQLLVLIGRITGKPSEPPVKPVALATAIDKGKYVQLKAALLNLAALKPQERGFAFETYLTMLFDTFGLSAREPFRLRGEQIDGSFQLSGETYLIEAKWQAHPIGVADLHVFQGKLEQKAAWTRGLFISDSGFSEDGLAAFGRGKRVVCMDGLDLFQSLDRELPLSEILERKVRHAAETGFPFVRVRDIYRL